MAIYANLIECKKNWEEVSNRGQFKFQILPSTGDQIALPNVVGEHEIYSVKAIRHFPLRCDGEPRIVIFIVWSHDVDQET